MFSFSAINSVFQQAREELPLGASNDPHAPSEVIERGQFIRLACDQIVLNFVLTELMNGRISAIQAKLLQEMSAALFAQAYQCGSCVDQASLLFVKLLEAKLDLPIDRMQVSGNWLLKFDIRTNMDGSETKHGFNSHNFVVLGRDEKESKLNDLSSWENVTLADTYGEGLLRQYEEEQTPEESDLTLGYFVPDNFLNLVRVEQNLEANEWNKYAALLIEIKNYISLHFHSWFQTANRRFGDEAKELAKLNSLFERKIELYKNLGKKEELAVKISDQKTNQTTVLVKEALAIPSIAVAANVSAPISISAPPSPQKMEAANHSIQDDFMGYIPLTLLATKDKFGERKTDIELQPIRRVVNK